MAGIAYVILMFLVKKYFTNTLIITVTATKRDTIDYHIPILYIFQRKNKCKYPVSFFLYFKCYAIIMLEFHSGFNLSVDHIREI